MGIGCYHMGKIMFKKKYTEPLNILSKLTRYTHCRYLHHSAFCYNLIQGSGVIHEPGISFRMGKNRHNPGIEHGHEKGIPVRRDEMRRERHEEIPAASG